MWRPSALSAGISIAETSEHQPGADRGRGRDQAPLEGDSGGSFHAGNPRPGSRLQATALAPPADPDAPKRSACSRTDSATVRGRPEGRAAAERNALPGGPRRPTARPARTAAWTSRVARTISSKTSRPSALKRAVALQRLQHRLELERRARGAIGGPPGDLRRRHRPRREPRASSASPGHGRRARGAVRAAAADRLATASSGRGVGSGATASTGASASSTNIRVWWNSWMKKLPSSKGQSTALATKAPGASALEAAR